MCLPFNLWPFRQKKTKQTNHVLHADRPSKWGRSFFLVVLLSGFKMTPPKNKAKQKQKNLWKIWHFSTVWMGWSVFIWNSPEQDYTSRFLLTGYIGVIWLSTAMVTAMVGKMGILARSLPGNLTIWREILTFEIKKYIRNSGKSDYLAGKNTLFQAVVTASWSTF